nr:TonB-dependent receptor [Allomuricauda sp.]
MTILFLVMYTFPDKGYSQQRVTFNVTNVTMEEVLEEIKSQTDFKFLYRNNEVFLQVRVSMVARQEIINKVLNRLFQNTEIEYQIIGKQIVLTNKKATSLANGRKITGKVINFHSIPLSGASIIAKETSKGTTTDHEGNFSMQITNNANGIMVSHVGYLTKEIAIQDSTNYLIILNEKIQKLNEVKVFGFRGKQLTDLESPVAVDVIEVEQLRNTGQSEIDQQLHYSVPSFSAVKFGINDLAPLINPASLRGLSTDQTLLLVNGKRRHKVSFFSLNHGVGKGQLGNDIGSIPSAAVKRVEILRDGASALYGSDAIAGVMNLQLNDDRSGGNFRFYWGTSATNPKYDNIGENSNLAGESIYGPISDGDVFQLSLNFGLPWGNSGFINTTLNAEKTEPYDRSGAYTHSEGWYPDDPNLTPEENELIDSELRLLNGVDLDRAVLGSTKNANVSLYINAGNEIDENWDFYTFFGGIRKEITGIVFSRPPARAERAVLGIYPNGYNPKTTSIFSDWQILSGVKGQLNNDWSMDLSGSHSGNNVRLFVENTVNPSIGIDSPTDFFTGALQVTQTVFNVDLIKKYNKVSLAFGSELRYETFKQTQGEAASWQIGPEIGKDIGSSGREGFSSATDGRFTRNNFGLYTEVETKITPKLLGVAALRYENYSDFGSGVVYKLAGNYKLNSKTSLRASVNHSFRAPALAQIEYSNFIQTTFDDDGNTIVSPFLPVSNPLLQRAIGDVGLKPETSLDFAAGFTFKPYKNFSASVDFYNISVKDRIVISSGIDAGLFSEFDGTGYNEINFFTNGLNTSTTGFDFVCQYSQYYGNDKLDLSLGLNLNNTKVDGVNETQVLASQGINIVDDRDITFLTNGTPSRKVILLGNYKTGRFGFIARATNFGEVTDAMETLDDGTYQVFSQKTVVDLSATYEIADKFSITAGANNVFDAYPDMLFSPNVRGEVIYSRRTNQFGTQGRFLNMALNYRW